MVGRADDLDRLAELYARARSAGVQRALIGGEAGIGKTRLVEEFARTVQEEAVVAIGHCVDLGGGTPGSSGEAYTPFAEILRTLEVTLGVDELRELAGPTVAALEGIAPGLVLPSTNSSMAPPHEALARLFESISAQRPLVLVIEDVHWIDTASLAALSYLSRIGSEAHLLLVITYRTEDVSRMHPARVLIGELHRNRTVSHLSPGRLDADGVRAMLTELGDCAPTPAVVDRVTSRSDGIPFYIEELVAIDACSEDAAPLPSGLRDVLLLRYGNLSPASRAFVRALAVGGLSVPHALAEQALADRVEDWEVAARGAIDAGVINVGPSDYSFRHSLVREAVTTDLLPGERERLHTCYAEALQTQADAGAHVAASIARHLIGAQDLPGAFAASVRAMAEARGALAFASAAQHGQGALGLWDRVPDPEERAGMSRWELIGRTSTYLRTAGDVERAFRIAEEGLAACPQGTLEHALLLRNKGRVCSVLSCEGATSAFREALAILDALPDGGPMATRADLLVSLAGRLMLEGEFEEGQRYADDGAHLAEQVGDRRQWSGALNVGGITRSHLGDLDTAWQMLERAWHVAGTDGTSLLRLYLNASDLAQRAGDPERAIALARDGVEQAKAGGVERSTGSVLASNLADPLVSLGRWDEAEPIIDHALAMDPPDTNVTYLLGARLAALTWRGRTEAAQELLQQEGRTLDGTGDGALQGVFVVARSRIELALECGDLEAAEEVVTRVGEIPENRLRHSPGYMLPLAWSFARLARLQRAGTAAAEGWSHEGFTTWPTYPLFSALVRAEREDSAEAWEAALPLLEKPSAPVMLLPYAQTEMVRVLLRDGDRDRARQVGEQGVTTARDRGIDGVAERLEGLLAADPAGPPGLDTDPTSALTPRERQVLDLVAEGLSNGEIGERLFITTKTASVHVSAILRKLGARSRTEAVYLAEVGTLSVR
jgi:DNA-binding CsgD family transcriptional regulator/tetratricopeptide (TPR) repeat protein